MAATQSNLVSTPNPFAGGSKSVSPFVTSPQPAGGLMTSIIPQNTAAFPATSAPAALPTALGSSTGLGSLGLVNHPALTAAVNSHPTSLTTSSDGTVKATYNAPVAPVYSSSGGAIIPQGGAPGTPLTPQTSSISTPQSTPSVPTTTTAFPAATAGLLGSPAANSAITSYYGGLINNIGKLGAGTIEGDLTSGAPTPVGQGNANAASVAESNAISAINQSEQNALTGQNQAQSGLMNAGQLSSPNNASITAPAGAVTTNVLTGQQYSNPIYEPSTGAYQALSPQPLGTPGQPGTAGQPQTITIPQGATLDSLATQYGTTPQALQAANPQITNPNLIVAGQSLTIPSSSGGSSTPFAGGVASGNAQLGVQYTQNNAAISSAKGLQTQLANDINTYGINSLGPANLANAFSLWVGGNLSNQGQGQFFQDLTDYTMTLAPLIGINGTQTDAKNYIANSMIPATNSGQTILGLAQNLYNNAVIKNNAIGGVGNGNVPQSNTQTQPTTNSASTVQSPSGIGSYSIGANGQVVFTPN